MMAEARRLRERRKALYSRDKNADFAPARAASLEMDDAPLMASTSSHPDAARAPTCGRDLPRPWPPPVRSRAGPGAEAASGNVSSSLASPSPGEAAAPPAAGGPRELVGATRRAAARTTYQRPFHRSHRRRWHRRRGLARVEPPAKIAGRYFRRRRGRRVSWTMGALDLPGAHLSEPPGRAAESSSTPPPRAETGPQRARKGQPETPRASSARAPAALRAKRASRAARTEDRSAREIVSRFEAARPGRSSHRQRTRKAKAVNMATA